MTLSLVNVTPGSADNAPVAFGKVNAAITAIINGATGPQGPAGTPGTPGATGSAGPAGTGAGSVLSATTYAGIYPNSATDSFTGLKNAIASVLTGGANAGYKIVIDAPITIVQGTDASKTFFIPSGVNIEISASGSITHDGIGVPLFVFSDSGYNGSARSSLTGKGPVIYNAAFGPAAYTYYSGAVLTFGAIVGGGAYTNGTYNWVKLTPTSGSGIDCFVQIVVSGGSVTSVTLMPGGNWGGSNFAVGNTLTTSAAFIGGTGSGFSVQVASVTTTNPTIQTTNNATINTYLHNYRTGIYQAGVSGSSFANGAQPFFFGAWNCNATIQIRGACVGVTVDVPMIVPDNAPACNYRPGVVVLGKDWSPGLITDATNAINSVNGLIGGSGYVNGIYNAVPGVGGAGTQATFQVTVAGSAVTSVVPQITGSGYLVGNTLTFNNSYLGGSGSGASINVATIGASLRNAYNMSAPIDCVLNMSLVDGYIMGIQGGSQNVHFGPNLRFRRYTDLQNSLANDPLGLQIGGVGYWTPPPHAVYVDDDTDASNYPYSYQGQGYDQGVYVGVAARRSSSSGNLSSWKGPMQFGGSLKSWTSLRPDCGVQFTTYGNPDGEMLNLAVTYNSTMQMLVKPGDTAAGTSGIVFPSSTALYQVKVQGTITDTAPVPAAFPIGSDTTSAHQIAHVNLDCITQDYPQTPYSVVNVIGQTITSLYGPTNGPSFGFAGTSNEGECTIQFVACTNTSKTNVGVFNSTSMNGCKWKFKVLGWRTVTGPNYDGLGLRLIVAGTGAANNNNFVEQIDVNNTNERTVRGAMATERWTQDGIFTPAAGANYSTSIQFASNYGVLYAVAEPESTAPAGPTSIQIGWTGNTAALIANALTNNYYPTAAPIPLPNNPTAISMTAVGGNFTGTGSEFVSVCAERSKTSE